MEESDFDQPEVHEVDDPPSMSLENILNQDSVVRRRLESSSEEESLDFAPDGSF